MSDDIIFADGIFYNDPHEKAPEFILGSLSINPAKFAPWLAEQRENSKGYVRLTIKRAKSGKPYLALDTWEPQATPQPPADDLDDDIPF